MPKLGLFDDAREVTKALRLQGECTPFSDEYWAAATGLSRRHGIDKKEAASFIDLMQREQFATGALRGRNIETA